MDNSLKEILKKANETFKDLQKGNKVEMPEIFINGNFWYIKEKKNEQL